MIMNKNELMARFSDITRIKKGGQKIVYKAKLEGTIVALKIINDARKSAGGYIWKFKLKEQELELKKQQAEKDSW